MRTEIYIENYKLDLTDDVDSRINKSVNDIRALDSKNTAFSRTITVPGTANNNKIFGYVYADGNETPHNNSGPNVNINYSPHRSAKCIMYNDGLLIVKGVARLMKVNRTGGNISYEISVYGELGGFAAAMTDKYLTDLDFSAYNQNWNSLNIINSWPNFAAGQGVFYPVIDYGLVSSNKVDYDFRAMRPALFMKEYIDKIFAQAGYTYDCPLFNSTFFKKIIIPQNEDQLFKLADKLLDRGANPISDFYSSITGNLVSGQYIAVRNIPYAINVTLNNFSHNTSQDEFTYTSPTAALVNISVNANFNCQNHTINPNGTIANVRAELVVNGVVLLQNSIILTGTNSGFLTLSGTVTTVISQNDIVKVVLTSVYDNPPLPGGQLSLQIWHMDLTSSYLVVTALGLQKAPMNYNDLIEMNTAIPKNILQRDFISSVFTAFNLQVVEDREQERKLIIRPYPLFYTGQRVGWSEKVDRSQPIELIPMGELTARKYNFKYEPDTDYYNDLYSKRNGKGYGDYIVPTGYEFATEDKDVKLLFAATPLKNDGSTTVKVVSAILKMDDKGVESQVSSKIRMLLANRISGVPSWWLQNWITGFGKITTATNSTTVTGNNTSFSTQGIGPGNVLISNNQIIGTVATVNSNTSITLQANALIEFKDADFKFAQNQSGVTWYGYAGHLDHPGTPTADLNWGAPAEVFFKLNNPYPNNNLYTAYWDRMLRELVNEKSAMKRLFVKLTAEDMYNVDFAQYIHIDGELYRLNKIVDYDTESKGSTLVELIRVIKP